MRADAVCVILLIACNGDGLSPLQAEIGEPDAAQPNKGKIQLSIEFSSSCHPKLDERAVNDLNSTLTHSIQKYVASC
jgi:hypothetical protein